MSAHICLKSTCVLVSGLQEGSQDGTYRSLQETSSFGMWARLGLETAVRSSWGHGMGLHMVVTNIFRHGSCGLATPGIESTRPKSTGPAPSVEI